jgi:hypothetical protein
MNDEFIPTLTHATERDIDLLLVEELFASPGFVSWVATKVGLRDTVRSSTVLHSKRRTRSRREIDIFVAFELENFGRCALLIENKLDATEQPDQAESYREELAVITNDFPGALMLIVCPDAYSRAHAAFTGKFDAIITYEELSGYFDRVTLASTGETKARAEFRRDILHQAINKHHRGYSPVLNEVVGDFNARYVALLLRIAPSILPGRSMLKPANPDESTSMIFDHGASFSDLPADIRPSRFAHELGRGKEHRANYVAVTFGGWGHAISELTDIIEADLSGFDATVSAKPATKTRPNPGLTVSFSTPAVDNQNDFVSQYDALVQGMVQAQALRNWLLTNMSKLHRWRSLAELAKGSK